MNLEERVKNLESLLLPKPDYRPDIYDFLFMAEQTIPGAPGTSPQEEALRRLGPRETFVNDYRVD